MSSMSTFRNNCNSPNIASGSGLTRTVSMTPEQLQRSLRLNAPGAPRKSQDKPEGYEQMTPNMQGMFPEYRRSVGHINTLSPSTLTRGNTVDTITPGTMRRTFSALPEQGAGSFIPVPPPINRINISTELGGSRSPTPVLGQTARSRSPTLANINEAFSPRTDTAVRTLSVMNACDSEGNVNNAQLNQHTLEEGLRKAAREQRLEELKNLEKSIREDRFSTKETTEYMKILDALRERVQRKSCIWDDAAFDYEEQVTLDHEDKSISEITSLLGSSEVLGLDLLELCSLPNFTVARVVQTTVGRMYHMTWNASPSVKLIVDEVYGLIMFKRVNDDVEVPTEHPCQCGTMIPLTAQLCGKTRCDNESGEEESEDEAVEPLNRSFIPEPLPFPEVGATYVRKERDGSPYEWILVSPNAQNEFMQPGHTVVVRKISSPGYRAVLFESKGGILSNDMAKSTDTFLYRAELSDFHRHMKLVHIEEVPDKEEDRSVEQTSGGSMSEQQSRSRLASMDALQRAQVNAKDSNDIPSDKKRKVQDKQDMEEEEDEASTPTKRRKVVSPKDDGVFVALTVKNHHYQKKRLSRRDLK